MKTLSPKEEAHMDELFESFGAGTGADIQRCIGSGCIFLSEASLKTGNHRNRFKKYCTVEEGNRREVSPNNTPCWSTTGPERRGH